MSIPNRLSFIHRLFTSNNYKFEITVLIADPSTRSSMAKDQHKSLFITDKELGLPFDVYLKNTRIADKTRARFKKALIKKLNKKRRKLRKSWCNNTLFVSMKLKPTKVNLFISTYR